MGINYQKQDVLTLSCSFEEAFYFSNYNSVDGK